MTRARLAAIVGALSVLSISVTAQQGQAPAPTGGGRIGGIGIGAYPQRNRRSPQPSSADVPPSAPTVRSVTAPTRAAATAGRACCARQLVLDDQNGELIAPVVRAGRADRGMPKFALTDDQIADIAAFLHTFRAAGYDESRQSPPSIVVGDAKAGESVLHRDVRVVPFDDRRSAGHRDADRRPAAAAADVADARQRRRARRAAAGAPAPTDGHGHAAVGREDSRASSIASTTSSCRSRRPTAGGDRFADRAACQGGDRTIRCSRTAICCGRTPTRTSTT